MSKRIFKKRTNSLLETILITQKNTHAQYIDVCPGSGDNRNNESYIVHTHTHTQFS